MAYDGWLAFGGEELINVSRTAQLAEVLGVSDAVWTTPESVQWIQDSLAEGGYDDITNAPWYDARHPASAEFAGFIPLSIPSLDDSTASASTSEYTTDGGATTEVRNGTQSIVASVAIIASTDRGADYGKRWLDRRLRGGKQVGRCSGSTLSYFQYAGSHVTTEIVNIGALQSWFAINPQNTVKRLGVVAGTSIDDGSLVSSYTLAWPSHVQTLVRERLGLRGGRGYIPATESVAGALVPPQPVTSQGTKVMWQHGLGGRAVIIGAVGDHVTFSAQPCTRVRVYYGKTSVASAGMRVLIDGVDQGVILSSVGATNSGGHMWESAPLPQGNHVVKIVPYNSPFVGIVEGAEFINADEQAGFRVYNGGHSGGGVGLFNIENMDMHWQSVDALNLDLNVISLGANDIASETVDSFLNGIDEILSKINNDAPVLLLGGYLRGDYNTEAGRAKWAEMQAGLRQRATGRVAYFDLAPHWPELVADGSTSDGMMFDTPPIHPNNEGMRVFAETITSVLTMDAAPVVHKNSVSVSRGTSITRKRRGPCSSIWLVTFTLTADDSFEYSEPQTVVTSLGGDVALGPVVENYGSEPLTQLLCPVYDYTPLYDPMYPAFTASPTAPDFKPLGWGIVAGMTFDRSWALVPPLAPTALRVVPVITLTTPTEARMVRVSIWPFDSDPEDQCEPLFSAVVTYLPANVEFVIDGEQEVSYVWDGASPTVRRTDSLVYSPDAKPVEWTSFNDHDGLLVTLDVFADSSGYEGDGEVRVSVALVAKSD